MFTRFWEFHPNRFRLKMEPHEPIWKSVTTNQHRMSVSIFYIFQNMRYMEPNFHIFHITDPRIAKPMCFWAWWRLGMFQESRNCLQNWKCWQTCLWSRAKVDRIYLAINFELSLFPKWHTHIGKYNKQIKPENLIFCIELPIVISYWHMGLGD